MTVTGSGPERGIVLFRRDYHGFSGGHLKVWHYFRHTTASRRFVPRIYLTPWSIIDAQCPWRDLDPPPLTRWSPGGAAALFVAGLDWEAIPEPFTIPVVNLVQGLRHADPDDPRHAFLSRPAVRICVSAEVARAITATGRVNGPVHVIDNAIDLAELPPVPAMRDIDVLVVGSKRPDQARAITTMLRARGVRAECHDSVLPRHAYLRLVARAAIAVFLPLEREGFYLPALEAMALGTLVVCPDCGGNRGFCHDRVTALVPTAGSHDLVAAVIGAIAMPDTDRQAIRRSAEKVVARHRLDEERRSFLAILDGLRGA
ncbi:MAG: glycosyltransferase [Planctomycetaceae bacterium]